MCLNLQCSNSSVFWRTTGMWTLPSDLNFTMFWLGFLLTFKTMVNSVRVGDPSQAWWGKPTFSKTRTMSPWTHQGMCTYIYGNLLWLPRKTTERKKTRAYIKNRDETTETIQSISLWWHGKVSLILWFTGAKPSRDFHGHRVEYSETVEYMMNHKSDETWWNRTDRNWSDMVIFIKY